MRSSGGRLLAQQVAATGGWRLVCRRATSSMLLGPKKILLALCCAHASHLPFCPRRKMLVHAHTACVWIWPEANRAEPLADEWTGYLACGRKDQERITLGSIPPWKASSLTTGGRCIWGLAHRDVVTWHGLLLGFLRC